MLADLIAWLRLPDDKWLHYRAGAVPVSHRREFNLLFGVLGVTWHWVPREEGD